MADSRWTARVDDLLPLPGEVRAVLEQTGRIVRFDRGEILFGPGRARDALLLLISGTIRVRTSSESGREIVLFRVRAGESCVLATACLLACEDHSAEAVAETGLEAAAVPRPVFDTLMAESAPFRRFVLNSYSRRVASLFQVIDDLAFRRLDIRLAQKLVAMAEGAPTLKTTHQELAAELGTAREVVSRLLQEFQRRGWISQARGTVHLLRPESMAALSDCV